VVGVTAVLALRISIMLAFRVDWIFASIGYGLRWRFVKS